MAKLNVQVQTGLALRDAAELFRGAMRVNSFHTLTGAGTQFSKPPRDEAFGDLDDDPPNFSVMATLGGGGLDSQKSAVALFGWDRGGHRELLVTEGRALLSTGVKSKWHVKRFVTTLRAADPSAQVAGI